MPRTPSLVPLVALAQAIACAAPPPSATVEVRSPGVATSSRVAAEVLHPAPSPPRPPKAGAFGARCDADRDCASGACATTGNVCTKPCAVDAECGGRLVCRRKDDDTGNWCSAPVGAAPGEACMNTWDCQHNLCLHYIGREDQPGLCSRYCGEAGDCPAGMKICQKVSDSGLLKLCLPGASKP
jgi:hypothetical protein